MYAAVSAITFSTKKLDIIYDFFAGSIIQTTFVVGWL